jgi:hypothetical protein
MLTPFSAGASLNPKLEHPGGECRIIEAIVEERGCLLVCRLV